MAKPGQTDRMGSTYGSLGGTLIVVRRDMLGGASRADLESGRAALESEAESLPAPNRRKGAARQRYRPPVKRGTKGIQKRFCSLN